MASPCDGGTVEVVGHEKNLQSKLFTGNDIFYCGTDSIARSHILKLLERKRFKGHSRSI